MSLKNSLTNEELADIAYNYRTGNLLTEGNLKVTKNIGNDNSKVISSIERLRSDLNKKPVQQVRVDELGNLIETVYSKGIKTTTKYKSKRRI